jgi:hypothetical protein
MTQVLEKFSCEACKRTYSWKKEIAGKRLKCKCGQPITVPVPMAKPVAAPQDDDLYALADFAAAERQSADNAPPVVVEPVEEAAPAPKRAAKASGAKAAAGAGTAAAAIPLGYRRPLNPREQANAGTVIDVKRDFYAPIALLIAGAILYLGYYAFHYSLGIVGLFGVSIGLMIMTVLETAVLIGFAFVAAGPLGVSFGGVGTAILKLAAIALFCDGVTTWVDGFIEHYGGGSAGIMGYGAIGLPVALGIYWATLIYLFSMDPGDSWFVVAILSIFYRILRIVLLLLLLKLILSFGGVAGSAISIPSVSDTSPSPMIDEINFAKEHQQLLEAKAYCAQFMRGAESPSVDGWYAAGAKNVWFETSRDINGKGNVYQMVVELPSGKNSRAKCYDIARSYLDTNKYPYDPKDMQDSGDPYILVPLPFGR